MFSKKIMYKKNGLINLEIIVLILIVVFLSILIIANIKEKGDYEYLNSKIDVTSKWYVNDLYMSNQYYYNNILNDEEKEIYRQLFESIKNIDKEFKYECSDEDFNKIITAVMCDHPELINFTVYAQYKQTAILKYMCYDEEILKQKVKEMQQEINKISKEVEKKTTQYEKEKVIYENLAKRSEYGKQANSSDQSAYTALMNKKTTVCAGYAKAAQILFQRFDIESYIAEGEAHMWNIVKIDDDYYYFDATPSSDEYIDDGISYVGLNQNVNTSNYSSPYLSKLPKPEGSKYNYYDYENKTLRYDKNDLSNIEKILKESKLRKVEIKISNKQDFLDDNSTLLEKLNLRYIKYVSGYLEDSQVVYLRKKE